MTTDDELLDLHAETSRTLVKSVEAQNAYGAFLDRILRDGMLFTSISNPLDEQSTLQAQVEETQLAYNEVQARYDAARRARQ